MYNDLRKLYIKPFSHDFTMRNDERPSVFKLIQLFTAENLKEMCNVNLGRFHLRAIVKRNLLI